MKRMQRTLVMVSLGIVLAVVPVAVHAACVGDCNGDGEVTVNEVIVMVNIALGSADVSACRAGDADQGGEITINEIILAVGFALGGCEPSQVCGNRIPEQDEECDDGGICIGGDNAGTPCVGESDCQGQGVCLGGANAAAVCNSGTDCPGGACTHCVTFGGDGCAANCTLETDVVVTLKPGELEVSDLKAGTSGATIQGDFFRLALPLSGDFVLTPGKESGGTVPIVIKADTLRLPRIQARSLACACVRGVAYKTCGGVALEADGVTPATNCTPGFTAGDSECSGKKPCAFLFGPGNAAAGTIGCNSLERVNYTVSRDAQRSNGIPGTPRITFEGVGGPGSAVITTVNAIGTAQPAGGQVNPCVVTPGQRVDVYGEDGEFCTDDDAQSSRGTAAPAPSTTGTASAQLLNANGTRGNDVGPFEISGTPPLSCSVLGGGSPNISGAALASAGTALDLPTIGDAVVATILVAQ